MSVLAIKLLLLVFKGKNLLRLAYAVKENINDLIYLGFSACVTSNFGSLGWSLSLSFESWHVIIINAQAYIRISCLMGSQKMVHYNIPVNIFWTLWTLFANIWTFFLFTNILFEPHEYFFKHRDYFSNLMNFFGPHEHLFLKYIIIFQILPLI